MLSHRNFTAFLGAFNNEADAKFNDEDTYLSFLPLPHVFERVVVAAHLLSGSKIVCFSGDMTQLKEDCQCVKPTVFVAVPRLYNKIVEGVDSQVHQDGGIKACMFDSGINSKLDSMHKTGGYESGFYDTFVFSKVR
eukprot:GHVR01160058.1.p1 GENE.GHVR01160058.1~~GHVR01160058.1.p1  ORF type:complete len:136 (+),score=9.51 GHVR01160058.1:2435-2842(+)